MTLQNGTHGTDVQTDGQTDRQTECDAICGPLLKEEGRIITAVERVTQSRHIQSSGSGSIVVVP